MILKFSPSLLAPSLLAIALAAPAAATPGGSVRDFQLPPAPTPTATPTVQGPVDIDGPVPVTPRAIPTSTPTPTPTPRITPSPVIRTPPAPTVDARRFTPAAPVTLDRRVAPATGTPSATSTPTFELTPAPEQTTDTAAPFTMPSAPAAPIEAPVELPTGAAEQGLWQQWGLWIAGALGLLVLLVAGLVWSRRREALADVAEIEPPLARMHDSEPEPEPEAAQEPESEPNVAPEPVSMPEPDFGQAAAPLAPAPRKGLAPIGVEVQPAQLSRSMMNATLTASLVLHNRTGGPLRDLSISADLTTAHAKVPVAEQLTSAATELAQINVVPEISSGKTTQMTANLTLPINQIRQIPQGRAAVYVPLLRLRVSAKGQEPVVKTFVIGMRPGTKGSKVQPFRLDEMPQTYTQIGSRPLD